MQKWEYLTVVIRIHGLLHEAASISSINGQELKNWDKASLDSALNGLGEDGWEMTGTASLTQRAEIPSMNYLFFKRPKAL